MNRRTFLQASLASMGLVPLVPSIRLPAQDRVRELLANLQKLTPNGTVLRTWEDARGADFADAFALVERYALSVDGVLLHPDTWELRDPGVGSFVTEVVDLDLSEREGGQVATMWGAKVRTHEAVPLGTVYVIGSRGMHGTDRDGRTHGLAILRLMAERHTYT